ncbi:MAG: Asp23/Gls24 family envelope stress response protein [Syntrophomonadaceae bacterium]|nr:Asp23/Gls24 family envelope stress response protein [Syntrophomonadaceae bacterium]
MYKIRSNELGDITVTRELVETLAGLAALDCYGLVGMVPQNIQTGISNILGIESIRKGVQVSSNENGLVIDVYVIVGYGIKITEVAANVMQKVTYVLENNAELPVDQVNVNVKGVKVLRDI